MSRTAASSRAPSEKSRMAWGRLGAGPITSAPALFNVSARSSAIKYSSSTTSTFVPASGYPDCCSLVTVDSYALYPKKAYNIGKHARFVVRLMRFAFVASSGEEHRSPMVDRLCLKLEQFIRLSADDREALSILASTNLRVVRSRRDIIREGEQPRLVNLIVDGWAIRYKMLEDGRRQIIAFLIPGDICDIDICTIGEMDHSIG